jgi:membrane-bound lytic murein transglycosylase D
LKSSATYREFDFQFTIIISTALSFVKHNFPNTKANLGLRIIIVIFFAFSSLLALAQEQDSVVIDSLEVAIAEEELLYKEDTTSFAFYDLPTEIEYIPGDDLPAVVKDKLQCIQKTIPLTYNDRIHGFINYFTVRDREYTRMVASRKNIYFPIFEKYLAKYGLPDELKYLAVIESGLNPKAVSRARAVGLWQFMSPTGRHYGLHHDWYIDDRMDPEKATDAACRYLRDLYGMFHNWELALASYNAGPGNVKKAIRRSGYKKSFWEVYKYLPRETRSYVPQFVAIIYAMNYLEDHNFYNVGQEVLMPSDTLTVNKFLHFGTFASLTGICLEDLQKLNPSVQRNAVPQANKKYTIKIPIIAKENLLLNRVLILDSASKIGKKELEILAKNTEGSTYGRDRIVYRVKSGDVLGGIAMRYRVKVNDLKKWNNLNSNMIRTGQRLNIWLRQPSGESAVVSSSPVKPVTVPMPLIGSKTYVVQDGDTLWDISRKFEGLTIEKIKQLNNLTHSKIQPGQKLVIAL